MQKVFATLPSLAPLRVLREELELRALRAEVGRLRTTLARRDRQIANLEQQVAEGFTLGYRVGREESCG